LKRGKKRKFLKGEREPSVRLKKKKRCNFYNNSAQGIKEKEEGQVEEKLRRTKKPLLRHLAPLTT